MTSYIELITSQAQSCKFKVVATGYNEGFNKLSSVENTAEGGVDITVGGIRDVREYTIRVRQSEGESGYGSLFDLRDLYLLNNPSGTPSNILTLRDHYYGETGGTGDMKCVILGDFVKTIIGYAVMGENAYFLCKIRLHVIPNSKVLPTNCVHTHIAQNVILAVDTTVSDSSHDHSAENVVLEVI